LEITGIGNAGTLVVVAIPIDHGYVWPNGPATIDNVMEVAEDGEKLVVVAILVDRHQPWRKGLSLSLSVVVEDCNHHEISRLRLSQNVFKTAK